MSLPSRRALLTAALAMGLAPAVVRAQDRAQDRAGNRGWPTAPVHLHVGFPAGSSADLLARMIAKPLAQRLGQPVVVENSAGAGGVTGLRQMLAAPRDGYRFCLTTNGPLTTAARLAPAAGDLPAEIAPVALIASAPLVLAVAADAAAPADVAGFITAAKSGAGTISYGSIGQGSGAHLTAELFAEAAGIRMRHVPLASFAEVAAAILEGRIDAAFMAPSAALPHVAAGRMRILGVTSAEPVPQVPEAPVIAGQAGLPANFHAELWSAFVAPAGTDPAVVARLNIEINRSLADPELQRSLLRMGWQAQGGTSGDLAARIRDDTALWGAVIDRIGKAD